MPTHLSIEVVTNKLGVAQLHLMLPGKQDPVMSSEIFSSPKEAMEMAEDIQLLSEFNGFDIVERHEGPVA